MIFSPDRITVWSAAGVQGGGIPNRTTIFVTLSPGATAGQINSAIQSCPANQVVFLNAGTYNLSSPLVMKAAVVLRGAGRGITILVFTAGSVDSLIQFNINGGFFNPFIITNWTAGYAQGGTGLTVTSAASIAAGNFICVDQMNDSTYVSNSGGEAGAMNGEGATLSGRDFNRLQFELKEVIGVSGNSITIAPGLYMPNYAGGFSPSAWLVSNTVLKNAGLEDLTVDGNATSADKNIAFEYCQNCWIKNVESKFAGTSHIRAFRCKNIEIRKSHVHNSRGSGVGNYGILFWTVTQGLIEDNICSHVSAAWLLQSGTNGCVVAYNYNTDNFFGVGSSWMAEGISSNHNAHPSYNLYEGNYGTSWYSDWIHGSGSHSTVLRNFFAGKEPGKTANTHPIVIEKYNRYMNIVGNILGDPTWHNRYEDYGGTITETSIYKLGYSTTYPSPSNTVAHYDDVVRQTLLRHGNYDAANHGIVWDSAISDHNIPNSLYLSSKPAMFGSLPWPPFDPAIPAFSAPEPIPAMYRFVHGVDPPAGGGGPVIAVSPTSASLGSVQVNTDGPQTTLVVHNNGTAVLIGTASVSAPGSIISGGTYSINPGLTANVVVGYHPTVKGNDSLAVTFTGGAGATVTIDAIAVPLAASTTFFMDEGIATTPFSLSGHDLSQPMQTTDPNAGGRWSILINVLAAGDYYLDALVNVPDAGQSSFFVNFVSNPIDPDMIWKIFQLTSGFESRRVTWAGNAWNPPQFNPKVWTLPNGVIELIIRGRELLTTLRQVTLTPVTSGPANPPSAPINTGPSNAATGVVITTALNWTGDGTSYDVKLGTVNPPSQVSSDQAGTSYQPTPLTHSTQYWWQIIARNAVGQTPGPVWSFTTAAAPALPDPPSAPTPADGATDIDFDAMLGWNAPAGTYDVKLDTAPTPTSQVATGLSVLHFTPLPFAPNTVYYWRVIVHNSNGTTNGPIWSFTTKQLASVPKILRVVP